MSTLEVCLGVGVSEIEGNEDEFRAAVNPFGGGMDWLEVRLPQTVPFRPRVQEAIASYRDGERSAFKPSGHYAAVVDLRRFDIADALLHIGKQHGPEHSHKVQLIGSAQFGYAQHVESLSAICDTRPESLQPMRTDLTVDVRDVPMSFVLDHARVQGKRFTAQIGKVSESAGDDAESYMVMGSRTLETCYLGKRPNCFRVYNKTAERFAAYSKFVRGWNPPEPKFEKWTEQASTKTGLAFMQFERMCTLRGLDPRLELEKCAAGVEALRPHFTALHELWERKCAEKGPKPTFGDFCGLAETDVITRFERQIGAQQIKRIYSPGDERKIPIFETLADLKSNLPEFNPFAAMDFTKPGAPAPAEPNGFNYSARDYMAGMFFRQMVEREGRQAAEATIRRWDSHAKELLQKLNEFAPVRSAGAEVVPITAAELYERYRCAIAKQLAA